MTGRRFFNSSERATLFVAANGLCVHCGVPLPRGWHADHVEPHIAGGNTDVTNGQALCPPCSLKKGPRMDDQTRESPHNRWQRQALAEWLDSGAKVWLEAAAPGAGKTRFSLKAWHASGLASALVLVPSSNLVEQWQKEAAEFGRQMATDASEFTENRREYQGLVLTYHGLYHEYANQRFAIRHALDGGHGWLLIADEFHHIGTAVLSASGPAWGEAVTSVADCCERKLLLSGTPFRTDRKTTMPFLKENVNFKIESHTDPVTGKVEILHAIEPNHTYSYGKAVEEKVCGPTSFPKYQAEELAWSVGDEKKVGTFEDDVDLMGRSHRLRTAISVIEPGHLAHNMLADAVAQLKEVRKKDRADAGGLIVAMTTAHADAIAAALQGMGERAVVVHSKGDDPLGAIERFRITRDEWIVSVKMVSEGTDIHRLRVGVYLSNVVSELFFIQFHGRFVRRPIESEARQRSHIFLPGDPRLIEHAKKIEDQLAVVFRQHPDERGPAERDGANPSDFAPVAAVGDHTTTIAGGAEYDYQQIQAIDRYMEKYGAPRSGEEFIRAMFAIGDVEPIARRTPGVDRTVAPQSLEVRKEQWKAANHRLVGRINSVSKVEYSEITVDANRYAGIDFGNSAPSEDQLKQKFKYLTRRCDDLGINWRNDEKLKVKPWMLDFV